MLWKNRGFRLRLLFVSECFREFVNAAKALKYCEDIAFANSFFGLSQQSSILVVRRNHVC